MLKGVCVVTCQNMLYISTHYFKVFFTPALSKCLRSDKDDVVFTNAVEVCLPDIDHIRMSTWFQRAIRKIHIFDLACIPCARIPTDNLCPVLLNNWVCRHPRI